MKKILCIGLVLLLFISVPIKGYSAAPVVYGIGEEVILPFLLALLGVQAKETVTSYSDLKDYHDEVYSTLIENLSGLASIDTVRSWLFSAAQGLINTDSVIWQKLYEIAVSNYVVAATDAGINVSYDGALGTFNFDYYSLPSFEVYNSEYNTRNIYTSKYLLRYGNGQLLTASDVDEGGYHYFYRNGELKETNYYPPGGSNTYTYDGKTVYYSTLSLYWRSADTMIPNMAVSSYSDAAKTAWLMAYGGYSVPTDNIASYSDAFDDVLTSSEKDDIVDGSSVIQLYNPAALQNGLEIIPGGDPEDDPNLKKIPFAVTADWWNFFQQFGEQSGNTYVNAYNALNGIGENVTTGLISKAYDALGIASIAGSAANAAQGIISLTDTNIYPASQTAADAITNTIPSGLTPEAPDSGIDNESDQGLYKLPDLRDYFPFCIPFDLIDFLSCFAAEPETPHFIIALSDGEHLAQENIDLEAFNNIAAMVRTFELAIFVVGLILITRNLIRG